MVQVLSLLDEISCGIDAGKSLEIVDEMGLIEVSAACGDIYPVKLTTPMDLLQDLLEAAHTAEKLGCKSHLMREKLDEMTRADADFI